MGDVVGGGLRAGLIDDQLGVIDHIPAEHQKPEKENERVREKVAVRDREREKMRERSRGRVRESESEGKRDKEKRGVAAQPDRRTAPASLRTVNLKR